MSIYPEKTIKEVLKKIKVKDILKAINYRTDTIQEIQDTIKCFCPIHQEQVFRTLIINTKEKSYRCSYSLCPGNKGGDLINFYSRVKKIDYDDAINEIVQFLNLSVELPTTQEFIDKTVEVAENYLELNVLDEAETHFKKVISVQHNNLRAHQGLYEIYQKKDNNDKSNEELHHIINLQMTEKKFDEAIININIYLEKVPESLEMRQKLIDCYTELGKAEECYGEYMNLADMYEMNQDFTNAIEVYRKLEKLDIDIIDVYSHIINLLIAANKTGDAIDEAIRRVEKHKQTDNFTGAIETLEPVLYLDKSRADIKHLYIDLILTYSYEGDNVNKVIYMLDSFIKEEQHGEAVFAIKKILNKVPDDMAVILKLIEIYLAQSNYEEAKNSIIQLSDIYLKKKDTSSAIEQLQRLIELQSDYLPALSRLSDIYIKIKDFDNSKNTLKTIVDIYRRENNPSEAIPYFQKLIDLEPENLDLKAELIDIYIEAADYETAYQSSLKLVDLLISKDSKDKAADRLKFSLELKPEMTDIRVMLADILSDLGKNDEAKINYFRAADEFQANNKPSMAIAQIKKIIVLDPKDIKASEGAG